MKPTSLAAGVLATLALLPATGALAASQPEMQVKLEEYNVNSKDFIFPSGLRVIFQADHSQPIVAITSIIDRGSTADPIGKEGIAHFVEHLWFRSEHGELPKVWDLLSELGCNLNASTAADWTNYMSVCPSTSLDALMKLESLRLTSPIEAVEQEVVDIEREVVRNELRMRYENSIMNALPYLFERLYPVGHPYQRLGIGSHDSLNNITLADIETFAETNYTPENTTIIVVGDFDLDRAADLVFEHFEPSLLHPDLKPEHVQKFVRPGVTDPDPDNPDHWGLWALDPEDTSKPLELLDEPPVRIAGEAPLPPEPADTTPGHFEAAVDHPTVILAWTFPGAYHGNEGPMGVAANQAGGYMASYFANDPRVRKDPVFGQPQVGCSLWSGKLDSKVLCSIEMYDAEDGEALAEKAIDQLSPLWTSRFDVDPALYEQYIAPAYNQAKMSQLSQVFLSLDLVSSLFGRATQISEHAHYTGSATYHSDLMNAIMGLNPQVVQDLAFQYLRRERAATVVLTPLDADDQVLDSSNAEYHGARKDDDVVESAIDPSEITDEYIAANATPPDFSKMQEKVLDNGLRVVVMPHGEVPVVQATLLYGGGEASDPPGLDDWVRTFTGDLWSGSSDPLHDPLRIAAQRTAGVGDNYEYEGMKASVGNLDGVLWLLRENVDARRPLFEGKSQWMSFWRRSVKAGWNDPGWWQSRLTWQNIAPDHAYSFEPGWDDYDRWNKEWKGRAVRDYMQRKYQPANATLLIVGRVDAQEAIEMAEGFFADWQPASDVEVGPMQGVPTVPEPAPGRVMVFDDEKNTQTNVTFLCPIAPGSNEQRAAQTLLGDYLDERAWIILREQSGVTYGAGAGTQLRPGGFSYLYLNSLVQNDSADLAVEAFYDIVAEVDDKKVDPERLRVLALNRAKKYVLGQQSAEQMTGRLVDVMASGRTPDQVAAWGEQLAGVGVDDLDRALGECSEHAVVALTGPEKVIGPSLTEAGFEYEVVDWESMRDEMYAEHDPRAYKKMMKAREKEEAEEASASSDEE